MFPGLTIGFYAGFLYKLVKINLPQAEGESEDDYQQRLNEFNGYVFISLGFSQLFTGLIMNRVAEKFSKFKLAIVGTLIVEMAGFTSFITYFIG